MGYDLSQSHFQRDTLQNVLFSFSRCCTNNTCAPNSVRRIGDLGVIYINSDLGWHQDSFTNNNAGLLLTGVTSVFF